MKIGILKERKRDERRVSLRPDQCARLVKRGHQLWVEHGAGQAAGHDDRDYAQVGANLTTSEEVYGHARLLLKVKCPLEDEYEHLSGRHVLFAYLHFDENISAENITRIVERGITGIAYEWVQDGDSFPLLQPMSELTGAVFARKAMALLMEHSGVLGGRYLDCWPQASALVIGAGHIGCNAISVFLRNNYNLVIVDKHPETIEQRMEPYVDPKLWSQSQPEILRFDETRIKDSLSQLRKSLPKNDIVICAAVRRPTLPKNQCEFLIARNDIAQMKPGSVICDATACDRDMIETAVSSDSLTETYVEEGVIHYNCDHVPSLVAQTATWLLTEATFPYVLLLAESGLLGAFRESPALSNGVMCHRGHLTHEYSACKKGLAFTKLVRVLEEGGAS